MTTRDLAALIGQVGTLSLDNLLLDVRILDAKVAYGTIRVLVTPVSGSGQAWVLRDRVRVQP